MADPDTIIDGHRPPVILRLGQDLKCGAARTLHEAHLNELESHGGEGGPDQLGYGVERCRPWL